MHIKGAPTMRLSVNVDPRLIEEARSLTGSRTKRETIELALREIVLSRKLRELMALEGSGIVSMEPDELQAWRDADIKDR